MPAAAKKAPPKDTPRQALCRELLTIQSTNPRIFKRIAAIKTALKKFADADGSSYREAFVDLGHVSVSPSKPAEALGEAPVIVVEAFNALPDARQAKLKEQGLVVVQPIVKRANYGQVRVTLHDEPEGDD